jgi:hypothetical protein
LLLKAKQDMSSLTRVDALDRFRKVTRKDC